MSKRLCAHGAATAYLAYQIGELGRGRSGFVAEVGPAWNNTVVVVPPAFGRTFRKNGNCGTDHRHSSAYWVLAIERVGQPHDGPIIHHADFVSACDLARQLTVPRGLMAYNAIRKP